MKLSEKHIRDSVRENPEQTWTLVREVLARTHAVVEGVNPGSNRPHSLRVFRAFLSGDAGKLETILKSALTDEPVVAAWALFGLAEIVDRDELDLPPAVFQRTEIVVERLGDYEWRGTLGESARQVVQAFRDHAAEKDGS